MPELKLSGRHGGVRKTWDLGVGRHWPEARARFMLRAHAPYSIARRVRAISISMVVIGRWAKLHYPSGVGGAFWIWEWGFFSSNPDISGYRITTLLLKDKTATSRSLFRGGKPGAVCGPAVTDY